MFFLYSILLAVGFLAFLPRFIFQKKYRASFWQRMGRLPEFDAEGKPVVWLHTVSVGETNAARPLVEAILENFPDYKLVISTTTLTGQTLARDLFAGKAALVFYFPFDFKFIVRRVLRKVKPSVVLLMETEIWFNFIREAGKSGAKIAIVNGRLSEKSANRFKLIAKTIRRVLRYIDTALMQTNADAKRLLSLGSRETKIKVTGNIKFDQNISEDEDARTENFRRRFDISATQPLIIAASTHTPEEKLILKAFKLLRQWSLEKQPRLMLVPRHPERFTEVADLIEKTNFDWARRSNDQSAADEQAQIILLDSIGELRAVLPLADIVFVGGSLIPHGGQNVLEPASARKAIVTGYYTMNFKEIVEELIRKDAIIQLSELNETEIPLKLAEVFRELLNDEKTRRSLAENAFQTFKANQGATAKTIEYLKPIVNSQTAAAAFASNSAKLKQ